MSVSKNNSIDLYDIVEDYENESFSNNCYKKRNLKKAPKYKEFHFDEDTNNDNGVTDEYFINKKVPTENASVPSTETVPTENASVPSTETVPTETVTKTYRPQRANKRVANKFKHNRYDPSTDKATTSSTETASVPSTEKNFNQYIPNKKQQNKYIKISPVYRRNSNNVECYENYFVYDAYNLMCEKGKTISNNPTNAIKEILHKCLNDVRSNNRNKANSIIVPMIYQMMYKETDSNKRTILLGLTKFINIVYEQYEDIMLHHNDTPVDLLEKCKRETGITFSPEVFYRNGDHQCPRLWFENRFSLYNPVVNFEHVCGVLAMMLTDKFKVYNQYFVYAMLFILDSYINKQYVSMKYLIYHFCKIVRCNFIMKNSKNVAFKPLAKYTNWSYGAISNVNIQWYGDVKLTTDENDIMRFFSFLPRVHYNTAYDDTIYTNFSNNSITEISTKNMFELLANESAKEDIYKAFQMFTSYDIDMRINDVISKLPEIPVNSVTLTPLPDMSVAIAETRNIAKTKLLQLFQNLAENHGGNSNVNDASFMDHALCFHYVSPDNKCEVESFGYSLNNLLQLE